MTFDETFLELMPQTCTREVLTGRNDYGEPLYGSSTTHRCRVVHKPTIVTSVASQGTSKAISEVVSKVQVWTQAIGWDPTDRITLPTGDQPVILDVRRYPDEDGDHHEVVLV